ncbi:MAG TPA: VCBS repeat-containing protein [Myxococcota bacterium]|nr:VCBS repeat-containing protein [Myxococcota bacterium]HNH46845.1 VCBS repeat-containing protein [Myxococcota bacterium]
MYIALWMACIVSETESSIPSATSPEPPPLFLQPQSWGVKWELPGQRIRAGDVNGDDRTDLVIFLQGTEPDVSERDSSPAGDVFIAFSEGISFSFDQLDTPALSWFAPASEWPEVADLNRDGFADVITFVQSSPYRDAGTEGWVCAALSTGAGFLPATHPHHNFAPGGELPAVGDFNADGATDLVSFSRDHGGNQIFVSLYNPSSGTFDPDPAAVWLSSFAPSPTWPAVGDVNGDGQSDLLSFGRDEDAAVWVATSSGSAFNDAAPWLEPFCPADHSPIVEDFNLDRTDDVGCMEDSTGRLRIALSTGSAFDRPRLVFEGPPREGRVLLPGDYDGDGLPDLAYAQLGDPMEVTVALGNPSFFSHPE